VFHIYFIIINMSNVIYHIWINVCLFVISYELSHYFGSRIQTQNSSPTAAYNNKINVKIITLLTLHQLSGMKSSLWLSQVQFRQTQKTLNPAPPSWAHLWHLTLRWLMSYIYGALILDVSRSHTTTQHSR